MRATTSSARRRSFENRMRQATDTGLNDHHREEVSPRFGKAPQANETFMVECHVRSPMRLVKPTMTSSIV